MNSFATFPFDSIFSIKFCIYWPITNFCTHFFVCLILALSANFYSQTHTTNQKGLLIMCLKNSISGLGCSFLSKKRSKSLYPNIHRQDYIELVMHGHCYQDTYICVYVYIYMRGRVSRPLSNHNLRFEVGFSPLVWLQGPATHSHLREGGSTP
jgi:hypothetical protein